MEEEIGKDNGREIDEYYEDNQVFESDTIKFKILVSIIDIGKCSQREFCQIVDKIYKEIFNKNKDKNNE